MALQEKIKQEYCKQKQTAVKRVTRLMSVTRLITERGLINYTSGSWTENASLTPGNYSEDDSLFPRRESVRAISVVWQNVTSRNRRKRVPPQCLKQKTN